MATRTTNRFPFLAILLMSLFIAAIGVGCGGGGGGTPAPPPNPNQDAQGLYTTDGNDSSAVFKDANPLNPDITKPLTDIKGMVYGELPNQDFIFFDIDANVLYQGTITSITLTDFVGTATVYNDGVMVENNVAVTGTVTSSSTIDMTLAASGDFVSGSIKGLFSTAYNNVATNLRVAADVVNPWKTSTTGGVKMVIAGVNTSNFRVAFANTVGSYTYGSNRANPTLVQCQHEGKLTSGAPKNIYPLADEQITATTNCTITNSPVYTGFASVVAVDGAGIGTEMWYATTNGTNSIFMILAK
ncbi:hypothetical protein MNBD_GAMMA23-2107 [hydrothermal vent metagenome]|uniref:Uncharacterized protein n=1 Tax=hydrothermal vent metagenome TaxID=652676 RepID=A0A3B1ABJ2_9ZZZZ